jgi:hypothetical protein
VALLDQSAIYHADIGDCLYQKLSLAIQPCHFGDRSVTESSLWNAVAVEYIESIEVESTDR